jgi:hypothetical protein
MRRAFLTIVVCGVLESLGLAAPPPQGCRAELISLQRLALPAPGAVGLTDLALAVDERGALYVSFASWPITGTGSRPTVPQLVSFDPNGKLLRIFERPSVIPETGRWARFTSLAYASGRVYAAAQWNEGSWRSALFIFETSGDLRRTVTLDGLGDPRIVRLGSNIGVIGTVEMERGKEMRILRTFSPDGEQMSERIPSEPLEPGTDLISDEAGRALVVRPSGEIEVLRPRKAWARVPEGFGHIHAAFAGDEAVIVNRVDPETRRASLVFLSESGERCEVDTTGRLSPMVRGADGFFYGVGQIGLRPDAPSDRREILVGKFRIAWRSDAR